MHKIERKKLNGFSSMQYRNDLTISA